MQNDPYAPPSAPVAEIDDASATPGRPRWVWVISVLYVLGGLWSLFITTMMHSGAIATPPEVRAYYESLSALDYTLTFLTTALNVSFMAERLSVFGLVVGVALLLTGLGLVILAFAVFGREPRAETQGAPLTARPVTG